MDSKDIYFNKTTCIICRSTVSVKQFNKHYNSKSCKKGLTHRKPLVNCPHCGKVLDNTNNANHVRWCKSNPKRNEYSKTNSKVCVELMNQSRRDSGRFNQFSVARIEGLDIPTHPNKGKNIPGTPHTEETKALLRDIALNNQYQRKCRLTHTYKDKKGRIFKFDSSWEDILADRLDELNLEWDRPDPVFYTDANGVQRRYFADFYLTSYDVYLDPKNNYVCKMQHEKLMILSKQIKLIVLSLYQCKNFGLDLLGLVL